MSNANARDALFQKIQEVLDSHSFQEHPASGQAVIVERLARAYRYAAGGPQPGVAVVEK